MTTQRERIRANIERIYKIESRRRQATVDMRGALDDAKRAGLDTKALREVVREAFADPVKLKKFRTNVRTYRRCR